MSYLVVVSIVWAFSFGLIGKYLPGLSPAWVGWVRLGLSAAVFLPFVRRVPWKTGLGLFAIGAVQFGFMYWAYLTSFRYLKSHEVALFTVMTPILVALLSDLGSRRFRPFNFAAASLAVGGAAVIKWAELESAAPLVGFLLVQVSNLCFAAGQLAYRGLMARLEKTMPDHRVFFWMHFGGFAVLTPMALPLALAATPPAPSLLQGIVLAYLGVVASGLCFFLWNRGARRVSAGQLAVLNNLKIPLGVAVSLILFREPANCWTLFAGALLIGTALLPVRNS
ncbi:MAG: EamA family transporter [Opitutae bacterium]|nr:EamA family transporter [Opitutae bacterium]